MTKAHVYLEFDAELDKVDSVLIQIQAIGAVQHETHWIHVIEG